MRFLNKEIRVFRGLEITVCVFSAWLLVSAASAFFPCVATGEEVPLADPFILYDQNRYYAYGTHSPNGIAVYTSTDLRTWKSGGLALSKEDSYGEKNFWAPEVYRYKGKYYLFYTANEHICVASGDCPRGPFRQIVKRPQLDERAIDNSLFVDTDGKPYLFFVLLRGENAVWMAELEPDLARVKTETMRFCTRATQPWELQMGKCNEGPFVLKHGGVYHLTYSANDYRCQGYGIGCATAKNLKGTWKKLPSNPILTRYADRVGVGHHSFFTDRNGALRIVFHTHQSQTEVAPRTMHIAHAYWQNSQLRIDLSRVIDAQVKEP